MISAIMEGKTQHIDNVRKSIEMNAQSMVAIMEGCLGNLRKSIHWPQEKETDNDTDSTEDYDMPSEIKGHHVQQNTQKQESKKVIDKDERDKTIQSQKFHGRRTFEGNEAETLIQICEELIQKRSINKSEIME